MNLAEKITVGNSHHLRETADKLWTSPELRNSFLGRWEGQEKQRLKENQDWAENAN